MCLLLVAQNLTEFKRKLVVHVSVAASHKLWPTTNSMNINSANMIVCGDLKTNLIYFILFVSYIYTYGDTFLSRGKFGTFRKNR